MAEVKYLVYFAHRMEFLSNEKYDELKEGYDKLGKKLWKFYETVRNKADS
jgi:acyl carrier protein phosphodiesterase